MTEIGGDKPVSHQMRETYMKQCSRGVSLFQETLKEYQKSQIDAQKEEYKDVMEKALKIIKETAAQALSQEMQKEELQLEKDYKNYIANPSQDNLNTLTRDLKHFKKEI
jgi:hypothetical protein